MSLTAGFVAQITECIKHNNTSTPLIKDLELFTMIKPLPIRLESFVEHFLYQLSLPEETLALAFLLIENLLESITEHNLHKIVFTAMSLSYKFSEDHPISNSTLEKISGFKAGILGKLESTLLHVIGWEFRYSNIESVVETLLKAGEIKATEKYSESDEENEDTDYTEQESFDSFSELSAFF